MFTGFIFLVLACVMFMVAFAAYLHGRIAYEYVFPALIAMVIFAVLGAAILDNQTEQDCSADIEMIDQ